MASEQTAFFTAQAGDYPDALVISFRDVTPGSVATMRYWDFGDRTPIVLGEASINHTYAQAGIYTVNMTTVIGPTLDTPASVAVSSLEISVGDPLAEFATEGAVWSRADRRHGAPVAVEARGEVMSRSKSAALFARFTARADSKDPLTVNFENTSTGAPVFQRWAFGDGKQSTDANTAHTYAAAGNYKVRLEVRDSAGASNVAELRIAVGEADMTAETPRG
jgi:PKD repeat protein